MKKNIAKVSILIIFWISISTAGMAYDAFCQQANSNLNSKVNTINRALENGDIRTATEYLESLRVSYNSSTGTAESRYRNRSIREKYGYCDLSAYGNYYNSAISQLNNLQLRQQYSISRQQNAQSINTKTESNYETTTHQAPDNNNMRILNGDDDSDVAVIEIKGNGESCRLELVSDKTIHKGSCKYFKNSKGIKIYCTPRKKICKTRLEVLRVIWK